MIPRNERFSVISTAMYYQDGYLITEYTVFVDDVTISGDYRHERVTTRVRVEDDA